jgi:hypothetical protein
MELRYRAKCWRPTTIRLFVYLKVVQENLMIRMDRLGLFLCLFEALLDFETNIINHKAEIPYGVYNGNSKIFQIFQIFVANYDYHQSSKGFRIGKSIYYIKYGCKSLFLSLSKWKRRSSLIYTRYR